MKTLLIHTEDPTTKFLSTIYDDKNWTIVNKHIGRIKMTKLIKEHDTIIMMGHGTEKGLLDIHMNFVIDGKFVYLLKEKINIGIWCNADKFFKKHNLKGLCTGMIISDSMEANFYNIKSTLKEIEESNKKFANSVKNSLNITDLKLTKSKIEKCYITKNLNEVINFNKKNIYYL